MKAGKLEEACSMTMCSACQTVKQRADGRECPRFGIGVNFQTSRAVNGAQMPIRGRVPMVLAMASPLLWCLIDLITRTRRYSTSAAAYSGCTVVLKCTGATPETSVHVHVPAQVAHARGPSWASDLGLLPWRPSSLRGGLPYSRFPSLRQMLHL